jgi:hypothetical protein
MRSVARDPCVNVRAQALARTTAANVMNLGWKVGVSCTTAPLFPSWSLDHRATHTVSCYVRGRARECAGPVVGGRKDGDAFAAMVDLVPVVLGLVAANDQVCPTARLDEPPIPHPP